jgi:hypothetical protein
VVMATIKTATSSASASPPAGDLTTIRSSGNPSVAFFARVRLFVREVVLAQEVRGAVNALTCHGPSRLMDAEWA